jgi:hypothetical protein
MRYAACTVASAPWQPGQVVVGSAYDGREPPCVRCPSPLANVGVGQLLSVKDHISHGVPALIAMRVAPMLARTHNAANGQHMYPARTINVPTGTLRARSRPLACVCGRQSASALCVSTLALLHRNATELNSPVCPNPVARMSCFTRLGCARTRSRPRTDPALMGRMGAARYSTMQ